MSHLRFSFTLSLARRTEANSFALYSDLQKRLLSSSPALPPPSSLAAPPPPPKPPPLLTGVSPSANNIGIKRQNEERRGFVYD